MWDVEELADHWTTSGVEVSNHFDVPAWPAKPLYVCTCFVIGIHAPEPGLG
jgi:hypothetical protein